MDGGEELEDGLDFEDFEMEDVLEEELVRLEDGIEGVVGDVVMIEGVLIEYVKLVVFVEFDEDEDVMGLEVYCK